MLKNKYFDIASIEMKSQSENYELATMSVSEKSNLFDEHFSGYPLLPGAFSLNICVDILKSYILKKTSKKTILKEVCKIAFLHPIKPQSYLSVVCKNFQEKDGGIFISVLIRDEENKIFVDGSFSFGVRK